MFDELTLERARSRTGAKWSHYGPNVLPAWVADMDIDPPEPVLETIRGFLDRGDLGYRNTLADDMGEAWVNWLERRHAWRPDQERVKPFTTVLHAMETALWNRTDPGDGVVCLTPIYHPFLTAISESGRRLVDVPLNPDGWRLDAQLLADSIDDTTRMILLCQPHNPTGRMFDQGEIAAVAEVAEQHDLLVVSDEIWGDLTYAGAHQPVAAVNSRLHGRLMTLGSTSKTFNLAGMRSAVAHIDDERLNDKLSAMPSHIFGNSNTLGLAAAVTAWTECDEWLDSLRIHLLAMRDHAVARLRAEAPQISFALPEATYLLWLDFEKTAIADNPGYELLKKGQVALEQGSKFGSRSSGYARLNFATSTEILDVAIDRIVQTVNGSGLSTRNRRSSGSYSAGALAGEDLR